MHEDAAGSLAVLCHRIGDKDRLETYEPHIAVYAAMITEVKCHLGLARGIGLVVAVVGTHRHHNGFAGLHARLGEGDGDGEIASFVPAYKFSVDIILLLAHHSLEMQHTDWRVRSGEMLPVPCHALIVAAATRLGRHEAQRVGCRYYVPRTVVVRDG